MQTTNFEKHVWAEIDLDALRANFRAVKERAGSLPLCAVVKADSYGHGAVQCSRIFAEEGAAWLAVSCLAEAMQLRRAGRTLPILILGHVEPEFAAALIEHHITAACYSLPQAKALSAAAVAAGGQVDIHLKADTGMGRIGFALRTDFDKAIAEMLEACALPGLHILLPARHPDGHCGYGSWKNISLPVHVPVLFQYRSPRLPVLHSGCLFHCCHPHF